MNREIERGKRTLLLDLLDVVDNLDRAIGAAAGTGTEGALLAGVRMVRDQFAARLEAHGVTEIAAAGEPFDPLVRIRCPGPRDGLDNASTGPGRIRSQFCGGGGRQFDQQLDY